MPRTRLAPCALQGPCVVISYRDASGEGQAVVRFAAGTRKFAMLERAKVTADALRAEGKTDVRVRL